MKCNKIRKMLSLYIDKMLDDNLQKEVEEHISACNLCKKRYDDIKDMTTLLNEAEMVPVPESFEFRMKKALQQERAKLSGEKNIAVPAKKNNKLRMLTSIAAIFAVGVISFGLYQDIIGDQPDQLDGVTDQLSQDRALTDQPESDLYKSNKNEGDKEIENLENSAGVADDVPEQRMNIYGNTKSAEPEKPESGIAHIPEDDISDSGIDEGNDGYSEDYSIKMKMSTDEFSRALTTSGVERNVAAVQYYTGLIEERLGDFKYEILNADFIQAGECRFRIYIFSGKGYKFKEEILAVGKDGEIEFIYTNDLMGL